MKTRKILEQIDFHGSYRLIPEIAEAHHEKIDGSGYPRGLKEHEIPIGSRIIAVADFFEAITAKRLYREPMPVQEAFEMLRRESDVHFSRDIVEAFINFYTSKKVQKYIENGSIFRFKKKLFIAMTVNKRELIENLLRRMKISKK